MIEDLFSKIRGNTTQNRSGSKLRYALWRKHKIGFKNSQYLLAVINHPQLF